MTRYAVVGTLRARERRFAAASYRQASRIAWRIIGEGAADVAIIDDGHRDGDDPLADVALRLVEPITEETET